MLHLEKLQQISANNLLFINSIINVNNELEYLQHLIEIVLVKKPSEKNSLKNLGCFYNSQILFGSKQIEVHLIKTQPIVTLLNTCMLFNKTHIYKAHNTVNISPNCENVRPLNNWIFS